MDSLGKKGVKSTVEQVSKIKKKRKRVNNIYSKNV